MAPNPYTDPMLATHWRSGYDDAHNNPAVDPEDAATLAKHYDAHGRTSVGAYWHGFLAYLHDRETASDGDTAQPTIRWCGTAAAGSLSTPPDTKPPQSRQPGTTYYCPILELKSGRRFIGKPVTDVEGPGPTLANMVANAEALHLDTEYDGVIVVRTEDIHHISFEKMPGREKP